MKLCGIVCVDGGKEWIIGELANEKLAIDKLQKCKYKLYMRYEGRPMNGIKCSRR